MRKSTANRSYLLVPVTFSAHFHNAGMDLSISLKIIRESNDQLLSVSFFTTILTL